MNCCNCAVHLSGSTNKVLKLPQKLFNSDEVYWQYYKNELKCGRCENTDQLMVLNDQSVPCCRVRIVPFNECPVTDKVTVNWDWYHVIPNCEMAEVFGVTNMRRDDRVIIPTQKVIGERNEDFLQRAQFLENIDDCKTTVFTMEDNLVGAPSRVEMVLASKHVIRDLNLPPNRSLQYTGLSMTWLR